MADTQISTGTSTVALSPRDQHQQFVDRMTTQVIAAMPLTVPDEDLKRSRARFRVAFSADAQSALMECTPESLARAIVMSALSGLYPGGPRPDVWLIPRRNKHRGNAMEVNWQMSFRGYIRLARRAGWELEPVLVFEGEKFEIMEGDKPGIVHVRNLDLPKTWETLRYGYIRCYPVGQRANARYGYLTKAEIQQRRSKAQDQSVWSSWPLEMCYKTLCNYAGNREMFPTDDPARAAIATSEQAEISGGAGGGSEVWGSLPAGSKTASLTQRLAAPAASAGQIIDLEGRPIGVPTDSTADAGETFTPTRAVAAERLSASQVAEIKALISRTGISLQELEGCFGDHLAEIEIEGVDAKGLERQIIDEVRRLAEVARSGKDEEQLPLGGR